jgi:hypothetical protein
VYDKAYVQGPFCPQISAHTASRQLVLCIFKEGTSWVRRIFLANRSDYHSGVLPYVSSPKFVMAYFRSGGLCPAIGQYDLLLALRTNCTLV